MLPGSNRLSTSSTEILISRIMGFPLKTDGRAVIRLSSSSFAVVTILSHAAVDLSWGQYGIDNRLPVYVSRSRNSRTRCLAPSRL